MDEVDFASYADDSTPYVTGYSIEHVINSLENDSIIFLTGLWKTKLKKTRTNVISL